MDRPDRELLRDAIDMHAHTGPALFPRLLDDEGYVEAAAEYGMRAFVLKDHDCCTATRAHYVNRHRIYTAEAIGAIVLNRSVGGLSPHAVQAALRYGARMVFMPTTHSQWHIDHFGMSDYPQMARMSRQLPVEGITILDERERLKPEVLDILDLVADADVCLGTSHLTTFERRLLLEEATKRGVGKFSVTHANWDLSKLSLEEQKEFIARGAYIEYVAVSTVSPIFHEQDPAELAAWIKELGPDHLVLASDLGQMSSPPPPEGLRMLVQALLEHGVTYEALETMLKHNPARLLGMEA